MSAQALRFDEIEHRYFIGVSEYVSVTRVLDPIIMLDGIPRDILQAAADLGNKVHRTCHLFNVGVLDEDTLDPVLAGYLNSWKSFLHQTTAVVIASEQRVMHRKLRFAGTLDTKLLWRAARWILDIKTALLMPRTVGPQTAAYLEADIESDESDLHRRSPRGCIVLKPDGTYKFHKLKTENHQRDWNMFVSCLNVHRWRAAEVA